MATLSSSDIYFMYTGEASGPSDATLSIGGTMNVNTITSAQANNIFDDVTGDESTSGEMEYRCIAIKDSHATAQMLNAKVWITGFVAAGGTADTINFAIQETSGGSLSNEIADVYTAPTQEFTVPAAGGGTVAWTEEGSPSNTLTYGTVDANGGWFGLWLSRTVPPSSDAFSNRSVTIQVQCETTGSPLYTVSKKFLVNWGRDAFSVVALN